MMAGCPFVSWTVGTNERDLECHLRSCDLTGLSGSFITAATVAIGHHLTVQELAVFGRACVG